MGATNSKNQIHLHSILNIGTLIHQHTISAPSPSRCPCGCLKSPLELMLGPNSHCCAFCAASLLSCTCQPKEVGIWIPCHVVSANGNPIDRHALPILPLVESTFLVMRVPANSTCWWGLHERAPNVPGIRHRSIQDSAGRVVLKVFANIGHDSVVVFSVRLRSCFSKPNISPSDQGHHLR